MWIDTDKKGRERKRDLRPQLQNLKFISSRNEFKEPTSPQEQITVELQSLISPIGQSIKPIHIQYWLSQFLGISLKIEDIKRNELILKKC